MTACCLQVHASDTLALQKRVVELFKEHRGAIVRVKAAYDSNAPTDTAQVIIGTGFFISREGHVLTNASVVLNPDRVWVVHEGVDYAAETIGVDPGTNMALLKLVTLPKRFNFLPLTDEPELPEAGTFLLRIGAPLELSPSPSFGMVSGVESRFGQHFFPCAHIRTTIPAGPGDGGAPYLDMNGRLVGIQVGSLTDINSTYLIPARAALRIRDDLLFSGKVTYGWIGFEVMEESSSATGATKIILRLVMPDTPAEQAGIMPGDELLSVGGYQIRRVEDLRNAMFYARVGEYIGIRVRRDGEEQELTVRLASRPALEAQKQQEPPPPPPEPAHPSETEPGVSSAPVETRTKSGAATY